MPKLIGVNSRGQPVGESHVRAKLTDHEVELILELHAGGMRIVELARKFESPPSTINDILKGRRRAVRAERWVRVTYASKGTSEAE